MLKTRVLSHTSLVHEQIDLSELAGLRIVRGTSIMVVNGSIIYQVSVSVFVYG